MTLTAAEVSDKYSDLNKITFVAWEKYFEHKCPNKDKYLEALEISTQHTDIFSAPFAIRDMLRCVQKYPETKRTIIKMMIDYHSRCSDPKNERFQTNFTRAYLMSRVNHPVEYNKFSGEVRQVINVVEKCAAKDMEKYRSHQLCSLETNIIDAIMRGEKLEGAADILQKIERTYATTKQQQKVYYPAASILEKGIDIRLLSPTSQEADLPAELKKLQECSV